MSEPVVDAPRAVSVLVLGEAELFAHSVERVLESSGFGVAVNGGATAPSVVVLVEPLPLHWQTVADAGAPAIVLTAHELGPNDITELVISGAEAVLPLDSDRGQLVAAVGRVASGESGLTRAQARMLTQNVRHRARTSVRPELALTPREREILETIDAGHSVKQTARQLGISPRTVENTQRVLYRKLAVRNRAQAVATAYRLGLLPGARS